MVSNKHIQLVSLLALFLILSSKVVAQSEGIVVLTDEQEIYPVGRNFEILEDKDKKRTIEDVTSPDIAAQFEASQEEAPGFGSTGSAYWVRFQIKNEAKNDVEWLLFYESIAFFIDFYLPVDDDQRYEIVQTGTARPFSSRDVPVGGFFFRLPIETQETKTIHMRFESEGVLILNFSILSGQAFIQESLAQQLLNGFLYGVMLILSVYNLVLFFYLKDFSYLFYVLFFGSITLGLMALDGFGAQYLWPNQKLLAASATRSFFVLSFTLALLFTTSFLRTKQYLPRLHRIMIGIALTNIIVLGLQFMWFSETVPIHLFLMLASCFTMIVAGILVLGKGYQPAKFFLSGWLVILVGFTVFLLTLVDVLSMTEATDSILRLGLVALALVLSFGLADRVNLFRREMEAAEFALVSQRTRIAQDLHDSVTQSLYSANLFAEAGQESLKTGETKNARHYFKRIETTTQQALKEMRLFLYESRPFDVLEVGLVDALQKRIDSVEMRSGMEARLRLDGEINYPDEVNDQFYRIAQEALNNVVKHAQADEVTVYLRGSNHMMRLEVVDNGCGFDMAEASQKGGMGLETMRERAAKINGDMTITTDPGQGTIIAVEVKNNDA